MASISAILLAAGESTRMGQLKALLPWDGGTLLEYQVRTLASAGTSEVIVVLGHDAGTIFPYVRSMQVKTAFNPQYRLGKTTSIKTGLGDVSPQAQGVLLLAVDQPRPLNVVRDLIQAHQETATQITAPRYQGHGGHPIIFSLALKPELERITEEKQGVREVMEAHKDGIHWVEVDDPVVRLDINDMESYQRAKALYSG